MERMTRPLTDTVTSLLCRAKEGECVGKPYTCPDAHPCCPENMKALNKLACYEDEEEKRMLVHLPLKIGDQAWGIRNFHGCRRAQLGIVHEMFFDHNMNLVIVVKCICRGIYGKTVFSSKEDCEAAIEKLSKRSAPAW